MKTSTLDTILAAQLRAMNLPFNLTKSRTYGTLLHVGAPAQNKAELLLIKIQSFYPKATYAVTDAEGCLSFALEGAS